MSFLLRVADAFQSADSVVIKCIQEEIYQSYLKCKKIKLSNIFLSEEVRVDNLASSLLPKDLNTEWIALQ